MKERLLGIIDHFGIAHQKRKFGEECDELKEAITEYEVLKGYYFKPHWLKDHIIEEIGDVLVVLLQFIAFYDIKIEEVVDSMYRKIKRTEKIVEDEINNI